MDLSNMKLPDFSKASLGEDLFLKFSGEQKFDPRRLGRITGSQVHKIGFIETKAEGNNKQDKLDWIIKRGFEKSLIDLAVESKKQHYSKLTVKQIDPIYHSIEGDFKLTNGADKYISYLLDQIERGSYGRPYGSGSKSTEHGHKYEPQALAIYEENYSGMFGYELKRQEFKLSKKIPYFGTTSDMNHYYPNGECWRTIEVKSPWNGENHMHVLRHKKIDKRYNDQTLAEMLTSEAEELVFISFDPDYEDKEKGYIEVVIPRSEIQDELDKKEKEILMFCEIYKQEALKIGIDLDEHFKTIDSDFEKSIKD